MPCARCPCGPLFRCAPIPCSRRSTPSKSSAVVCAKCDEQNRKTRCAGCGKPTQPGAPTDEALLPWHLPCFRAFHPHSLLLREAEEPSPSGPQEMPHAPQPQGTLVPSPHAAVVASRRRKSLRVPTEPGGASVALLQEALPPTIPEAEPAPVAVTGGEEDARPRRGGPPVPSFAFTSTSYEAFASRLKAMGLVRERMHRGVPVPDALIARELVSFAVTTHQCGSVDGAVALGRALCARGFLKPVGEEAPFDNGPALYHVCVGTPGPIAPSLTASHPLHIVDEPVASTFATAILQEGYFFEYRGRASSSQLSSARVEEAVVLPMTTNPLHAGESRDTKAGFLLKQGHKVRNWKRRWFVLRGQTLLYFRKAGDEEPAGSIDLADFFLEKGSDPAQPLRMLLSSKRSAGLEYVLQSESPKDFVGWAKAIDAAMGR